MTMQPASPTPAPGEGSSAPRRPAKPHPTGRPELPALPSMYENRTIPESHVWADGTMPCFECTSRGIARMSKIGNRRSECSSCNAFAQRVRRRTLALLRESQPEAYVALRAQVEIDTYAEMMKAREDAEKAARSEKLKEARRARRSS